MSDEYTKKAFSILRKHIDSITNSDDDEEVVEATRAFVEEMADELRKAARPKPAFDNIEEYMKYEEDAE